MKKKLTPAERWMRDNARLDAEDVAVFHARRAGVATNSATAREDERAATQTLRRAGIIR